MRAAALNPAMACPLCGEICTCLAGGHPPARTDSATSLLIDPEERDWSEQRFAASLDQPSAREAEREAAWNLVDSPPPEQRPQDTPVWRDEVTSRLASYRARRRRPRRQQSLSLDFERAANRMVPLASRESLAASQDADPSPASSEHAAAPAQLQQPEAPQPPESASNVIEFPRLAFPPPPPADEIAEPILDKPRILDVPEEVETAKAPLAGIKLEPDTEHAPEVHFEVPIQVAPMSRRILAGMADALLVMMAAATFLMIVLRTAPIPHGKPALALLAAPSLFWAIYEYIFLVHGGRTPGMQWAGLALMTFEGRPVRRRARRARALALVLSSLSLGLGLVWALLDEDTLCWHDRITRTYPCAFPNFPLS